MRRSRKELLTCLQMVAPGSNRQGGGLAQTHCVVLRKGRLYTLSRELACAVPSGLASDWEAALPLESCLRLLRELPDDILEIGLTAKYLTVKGAGRSYRLATEGEVLLPVSSVLPPRDWSKVHADFAEAVALACACTRKKKDRLFAMECVHLHPEHVEASDNLRMLRYPVATGVKAPLLVRGSTLLPVTELGMTEMGETPGWLHFKNPVGLRVSCRKYAVQSYPPLGTILALRGQPLPLPEGIAQAAKRCGYFAQGGVRVEAGTDQFTVSGRSADGTAEEQVACAYRGPGLAFLVVPGVVADLMKVGTRVEVTRACVRVAADKFVFCAALEEEGNHEQAG